MRRPARCWHGTWSRRGSETSELSGQSDYIENIDISEGNAQTTIPNASQNGLQEHVQEREREHDFVPIHNLNYSTSPGADAFTSPVIQSPNSIQNDSRNVLANTMSPIFTDQFFNMPFVNTSYSTNNSDSHLASMMNSMDGSFSQPVVSQFVNVSNDHQLWAELIIHEDQHQLQCANASQIGPI